MSQPIGIMPLLPKILPPPGAVPYLTPPGGVPPSALSIPKPPLAGLLGVLALSALINDAIGRAGGYKWRDDSLAKIGNGKGAQVSPGPAPFNGGQSSGVAYLVLVSFSSVRNGDTFTDNGRIVNGPISSFSYNAPNAPSGDMSTSGITIISGDGSTVGEGGNGAFYKDYRIARVTRLDGLPDTGGDPDGSKRTPTLEGYKPSVGSPSSPSGPNYVPSPPPMSPARSPARSPAPSPSPESLKNPPSPSPNPPANPSPSAPPLTKPQAPPNPSPSPPPEKKVAEPPDKKPTEPPPKPDQTNEILGKLAQIIGITSLINSNTSPEALKNAAKTGSCESLQSPQCTKGVEDRIKDPIMGNVDATKVQTTAILANQGIQNGVLASVISKLDAAKTFGEKVARAAKLDKVYNFLTFITVIHNAQMLSSSLATTLMDSLSLGLATGGIKDENESPIDIQSIINKSVEDKVKEIIGAANYTTMSDRWKKAVRVYQAAANMAYQVRSLWDSARSLAELTGANVGKIGNALRRDGAVSENAYGAMADNPLMVNSAMTKLQNLEEAASHINSITSEAYGVTETVAQIKKDQDDFKKLAKEGLSSPAPIVNDQQKAKDDAAKVASVSPSIAKNDLVKPD